MIDYDSEPVPKELCSIDRHGGADDFHGCGACFESENPLSCEECVINKIFKHYAELTGQRMKRQFPVLFSTPKKKSDAIPWEVIAPHEEQAHINHGQSLERLAERGGLSYREMYAVLRNKKFDYENGNKYSDIQYELEVLRIIKSFYLVN